MLLVAPGTVLPQPATNGSAPIESGSAQTGGQPTCHCPMQPLIRASNGFFHDPQLPSPSTSQKQLEIQIQTTGQNFHGNYSDFQV